MELTDAKLWISKMCHYVDGFSQIGSQILASLFTFYITLCISIHDYMDSYIQ